MVVIYMIEVIITHLTFILSCENYQDNLPRCSGVEEMRVTQF